MSNWINSLLYIFTQKIYIVYIRNTDMVVRMSWMVSFRKYIIILVIFCLLGTLTKACHYNEEEEKCYKEEKEETIVEEEEEPHYESVSSITESKWFIILDRLIERYPILERIIERIFQWIFNNLLGLDY